jgi:predicted RND superfamily exporter protein
MTGPLRTASTIVVVLLTVVALGLLPGLRVDNRLERWLGDDAAEAVDYAAFLGDFGSDELLMVVVTGPVLTPEALELQLRAVESIEAIRGVGAVRGIAQVWRDLFGAEDPQALVEEVTRNPFYDRLLISEDRRSTAILVAVAESEDAGSRRRVVAAVREASDPLKQAGFEVDVVGSTALSAALDEVSESEARRAFPIALVGSLVVLALLLRSVRATVVAASCSAITVVLTLGLIAATGRPLTMVTTALPPLLWVLSLGNIVHVLRRFQVVARDGGEERPLDVAVASTRRACVLASVTTAAGFVSLTVAPMQPIRELGGFAAAGILMSLPVTLGVGPMLIEALRVQPAGPGRGRSGLRWGRIALKRPRLVVWTGIVALIAASACLLLIRVESNPLAFLPEANPTADSYHRVGGRVAGFYTLEVVLEPAEDWRRTESLVVIDRVANELETSPVVSRALSPVDVVRQLAWWDSGFADESYSVPSSDREVLDLLRSPGVAGTDLLNALVSGDHRRVRVSALVDEMEEGQFLALVDRAKRLLEDLPAGWAGTVTGQVLRLVNAQQRLVRTQLISLGTACVLVFACLWVGLGSARLVAFAVVPNLAPPLAAFAAMGILRMPLDAGTVMVASVALGIAVDNTAHILEGVRRRIAVGSSTREAIRWTLERVGSAMVVTSVTAAIGFLSLTSSRFVPIRDFGVLATVAIIAALAGDMLLLPAMMLNREERG